MNDTPVILPMQRSDEDMTLAKAEAAFSRPMLVPAGSVVTDTMIKLPPGSVPSDVKYMPKPPPLLRIPTSFHSVDEVLGAAAKMDLPNCVVISELESGALVLLDSGLTMAQTNWTLDRLKALMLAPDQPTRR